MARTVKDMFEANKAKLESYREDLKSQKNELVDLENQLMVEERIFSELTDSKDELAEDQKYIVGAVKDEIMMQKNKISDIETDIKLIAKKHEVLSRNTWRF